MDFRSGRVGDWPEVKAIKRELIAELQETMAQRSNPDLINFN